MDSSFQQDPETLGQILGTLFPELRREGQSDLSLGQEILVLRMVLGSTELGRHLSEHPDAEHLMKVNIRKVEPDFESIKNLPESAEVPKYLLLVDDATLDFLRLSNAGLELIPHLIEQHQQTLQDRDIKSGDEEETEIVTMAQLVHTNKIIAISSSLPPGGTGEPVPHYFMALKNNEDTEHEEHAE